MNICRNQLLRTSGEIAKARAELAVASDRLDCSVEDTQQMQTEIVNILSKYLNLDNEIFEIELSFFLPKQ